MLQDCQKLEVGFPSFSNFDILVDLQSFQTCPEDQSSKLRVQGLRAAFRILMTSLLVFSVPIGDLKSCNNPWG